MVKTKVFEDIVSLEIDLVQLFGRGVQDAELRQVIADEMIEIITDRTRSGKGVENGSVVKFKGYTKRYMAKTGKSNPVDLDQSGRLLNALKVIKSNSKILEIGITGDQAPKAHGHMTGQYGEGPLPRRSFLGLAKTDFDKIRRQYQTKVQRASSENAKKYMDAKAEDKFDFSSDDVRDAIEWIKKNGLFR